MMRNALKFKFQVIILYGFLNCMTGAAIPYLYSNGNDPQRSECAGIECLEIAYTILQNMDINKHPCDNFYEFACGSSKKRVKSTGFNYDVVPHKDTVTKMKHLLESDNNYLNSVDITGAKQAYKACMDTVEIKANGLNRLMKRLNLYGGVPMLKGDSWSDDDFDLIEITRHLRKTGNFYNYFLDISVQASDVYYNYVIQRPKVHNLENKFTYNRHKDYIINIMTYLGGNKTLIVKDVEALLDFEVQLRGKNVLYHQHGKFVVKIPAKSIIQKLNDSFPIESYIKAILPENAVFSEESEISYDSVLFNWDEFKELMKNTSKRVQANYLLYRLIDSAINNLFVLEFSDYKEFRSIMCADKVSRLFYNFRIAFFKTYIHKDDEEFVKDLTNRVQKAFADNIKNSSTLDKHIKEACLTKLKDVRIVIGDRHSDAIFKLFANQNFVNKSFEFIITTVEKMFSDNLLNEFGKFVDIDISKSSQNEANIYYSASSSTIRL